jgi:hypothetical protein
VFAFYSLRGWRSLVQDGHGDKCFIGRVDPSARSLLMLLLTRYWPQKAGTRWFAFLLVTETPWYLEYHVPNLLESPTNFVI